MNKQIELINVDKYYGKNHVLRGINLQVNEGEFITFLGPSGCGKTTTLRVIAGLEKSHEGKVLINGQIMADSETFSFVPPGKRGLNLVFQSYALWPHMTVFENVAFVLKVQKCEKNEIEKRVMKSLDMMRIGAYKDRYPSELSGGQQQRVAIARAMVSNPKVLLLDEPLSNLDAKLRLEMRSELKRLHRELGTTMIYVTHDQVEALTLSTRIAVFSEGEIVQTDTPMELYMNPVNVEVANFIGNPRINLLSAKAQPEGGKIRITSALGDFLLQPDEFLPGEWTGETPDCVIGLRPEHIRMAKTGEKGFIVLTSMLAGSETLIEAERNGERILVKGLGFCSLRAGDEIYPDFLPDHINIFRKDNGRLIKKARF